MKTLDYPNHKVLQTIKVLEQMHVVDGLASAKSIVVDPRAHAYFIRETEAGSHGRDLLHQKDTLQAIDTKTWKGVNAEIRQVVETHMKG